MAGKHEPDPAQYNAAAQARSVIGLIDELALGRPVIGGYDGAGHFSPLEAPGAFAEAIVAAGQRPR